MPYLIDGHNLIPKIPGLSLEAVDDEIRLIELLQDFCRVQRKQVEVYFDNAPAGQSGKRRYGQVTAFFVRQGNTADEAIRQRLARLGKIAKNWVLVSSDGQVQADGRAAHARVVGSEQFRDELRASLERSSQKANLRTEGLSADEVDEWLILFKQKRNPPG